MEKNGRWRIEPYVALTVAINLIGWGITLGTILARLDEHDRRLVKVEHKVFPEAQAQERKQ